MTQIWGFWLNMIKGYCPLLVLEGQNLAQGKKKRREETSPIQGNFLNSILSASLKAPVCVCSKEMSMRMQPVDLPFSTVVIPAGKCSSPLGPTKFYLHQREKAWRALCFLLKLLLRLLCKSLLGLLLQLSLSAFCYFPALGAKPEGLWDHFQCKCDLITIALIKDSCTLQVILINSVICPRNSHIFWAVTAVLLTDIHFHRLEGKIPSQWWLLPSICREWDFPWIFHYPLQGQQREWLLCEQSTFFPTSGSVGCCQPTESDCPIFISGNAVNQKQFIWIFRSVLGSHSTITARVPWYWGIRLFHLTDESQNLRRIISCIDT